MGKGKGDTEAKKDGRRRVRERRRDCDYHVGWVGLRSVPGTSAEGCWSVKSMV